MVVMGKLVTMVLMGKLATMVLMGKLVRMVYKRGLKVGTLAPMVCKRVWMVCKLVGL